MKLFLIILGVIMIVLAFVPYTKTFLKFSDKVLYKICDFLNI